MATIPLERGGTYHPGTWKPTIDTDSVGGLLYAPNQQPYSYCYPSRPMGEAGTASRPQSRSPPGGYITAPSSPTSSSPSSPSSSRSSTSSPSPTEETNENPSLPASSSTLPPMPVSVKSRPTTDLETTGDRPHPVASTSFAVNNMAPHNRVGRAPPLLSSNPLRPSTHLEEDRNNPEPATSSSPPNSATMLLSSRGAGSMPLLATNRGHHREEVITRLATTTLDIESRHHQIGCHLVRILDLVEELVGLDRQKQELTSQFWMNGMDLHSQVHLSHVLRSRRVASRRPYPRSPVSPSLSTYSDEDIKKMGRDFSTDTSTLSSALKQRWLL